MAKHQIVDLDEDPAVRARDRVRLWLRVGLPIAGVVVIAAGIVAGTLVQYQRNRADALALSDDLVATLQQQVQREVSSFLRPAADGAALLASVMPAQGWSGRGRQILEAAGMRLMRRHAQIGPVYVGRGNGDFVMLRRASDGAIDTKLIRHRDGRRRTTWVRRDPAGEVIDVEADPDDTYDPRTRSWYKGALAGDGMYWSEVYVFFTDKAPGITVAMPVQGSERQAVVGVDLRLSALNDFLEDLQQKARGRMVIVDGRGKVVAAPDAADKMKRADDGLETPAVHALDDPVLSEAYDRMRLEPDGSTIVEIDGTRHILAAASLGGITDRTWRLLLVARESAFVGFVAANSRQAILILGTTVVLATGMAGTLAYLAVQADRRQRRLEIREAARGRQMAAMDTLLGTATGDGGDHAAAEPAPRLARDLATAAGAGRAGIWQRQGSQLVCASLYDADARAHTEGSTIERHECPALFDSLDGEIAVADAAQDPRTRDLATCYLTPSGMRALLSVPIRTGGETLGAVWLEAAAATDLSAGEGLQLARLTAGLLALRWRTGGAGNLAAEPAQQAETGERTADSSGRAVRLADGAQGAAPAAAEQMRTTSLAAERTQALREVIGGDGATDADAALYPHATVAVVRLLDDAALARTAPEAPAPMIARVIESADRCARELNIPYIKLMGAQLIVADGFDDAQAEAAVMRVAEFALRFRGSCAEAFLALNAKPAFSIGIDTGPVMGSAVGFGRGVFNVWGDALNVASNLAAESTAGHIQVSGACYAQLQSRYLLRPSGVYYLERGGEVSTYDLRASL